MAAISLDKRTESAIRALEACGKHVVRARINGRGITLETSEGVTVTVAPGTREAAEGSEEIIL